MKLKKSFITIFISLILMCMIPISAYAHTGLKSSIPENKQKVTEALKEVIMNFNTSVEPLSSFEITDIDGAKYKLSKITIDDTKMSGVLEKALPNGNYTVDWKIVGRDGHPIKGSFSFAVDVLAEDASPVATSTASIQPSATSTASVQPSATASLEPSIEIKPSAQSEELKSPSNASDRSDRSKAYLYVIGSALVILLVVIVFVIVRLERRK